MGNNQLLICKSCKKEIHSEADSCTQCGDKDPFLFKELKSKRKELAIKTSIYLFLPALIIAGLINGALEIKAPVTYIIAFATWIGLICIARYFYVNNRLWNLVDSYGRTYKDMLGYNADEMVLKKWHNKAKDIVFE